MAKYVNLDLTEYLDKLDEYVKEAVEKYGPVNLREQDWNAGYDAGYSQGMGDADALKQEVSYLTELLCLRTEALDRTVNSRHEALREVYRKGFEDGYSEAYRSGWGL